MLLRTPVTNVAIKEICDVPDEALVYIYRSVPVRRAFNLDDTELAILDNIRKEKPIYYVRDFNGLPVYYFEFPMSDAWFDFSNWLMQYRALFDARVVKRSNCPSPFPHHIL